MSNQLLYTRTPSVVVYDNRGSSIREISYCRHPDSLDKTDERITRHQYHARGYLERSIDARLYDAQQSDTSIQPNIQQTISLGGAITLSQGVDNGTSFSLNDIEGTVSQQINAQGTVTTYEYSKQSIERYLEQVKEGKLGESRTAVVQKLKWGQGNASELINTNQVGKCIEHFDTAGKKTYRRYSLHGAVISETQQFVTDNHIDWAPSREASIEHTEKYTTEYRYDATGTVLTETDSTGHQRRLAYDIAGFVKQTWLTLKGQSEQEILRSLSYSAAGQKLREEQGNGLVTTYEYEPETQRLLHVKTERPQGHALGAKVMQDLRYEYDAVGNIICLKNDAEATRYWRNQKVVPENRYIYDSLYQLVSATGRESANQKTPASMQSQPVTTLVKDTQSYTNYTRFYTYDRGGNLTQIRHTSSIAQQSFTQDIIVSNKTNRALLKSQCSDPQKVDGHFDVSGNLTTLSTGAELTWNTRNTLEKTTHHINSHSFNNENYCYNSLNQRTVKIKEHDIRQSGNGDRESIETMYLPNIEKWQYKKTDQSIKQKYDVVQIQTGTSVNVRALCWEIGLPKEIENNQLRYSYDDGIGNCGLETDGQGKLVSYEEYYPYGGTAIWFSQNALEATYKTIRYSGKEKDATGLYYYGYRYYQPWVGRWLSADPAGTIDGLNLYRMVRNNPVTLHDPDGRAPTISAIPNDTPLTEIFQWGDILYGLDEPLESFVSVLNSSGFKRKEAIKPSTNNIFKLIRRFFRKAKEKTNIFIQSDVTNAVWDINKPTEYSDDKRTNKQLNDPERAIQFKQFISSHERYNVIAQDEATELKLKPWRKKQLSIPLWNKTSKAGLEFQLLVRKKPLHFIADIIGDDIGVVVSKKGYGASITSSELRWLYRHRDLPEVRSNLTFYRDGKKISHEEIFGKSEWSNYHPKNQYNKIENELSLH
ncbi:RHS repeat-associated core domain-containing protein [Proteus faecis]|uniref:Toxin n=1 Tax=Proteus faecis TaxID=2050967 RepID=A0ABZ3EMT1_9GAMM|nr:RHS repeat-associated core domain-containing protein [Proteus faecis]MDM3869428.1 RHS repeat-associated core domain-containing protein [Proteus faecis]